MQSVQAFQQVSTALSWPANNMAAIAQWRASVERVLSLVKALEDLEAEINKPDPQRILVEKPEQNVLVFDNLCLSKLNGEVVLSNLNASITQGEHVLIKGDTANGSKLFKAIAGIWPWGSGRIELPDGDPLFFMSPRPFLPEGTLRTAICYPCLPGYCRIADLEEFFKLVGLEEFIPQLDQEDKWDMALTRAQQQRLGVVRLLLYAPKWILIEEAFDSLDPETEVDMLRLICQQLPDATLLTMSNQPTAEVFHNRHLVL
jgi:putative ATP-binding cassette transporter